MPAGRKRPIMPAMPAIWPNFSFMVCCAFLASSPVSTGVNPGSDNWTWLVSVAGCWLNCRLRNLAARLLAIENHTRFLENGKCA